MARTRDITEFEAMQARIKHIARQQMTQFGTAGLSLRAIAREIDVITPALYRYFSTLDDLITALIIDAFDGMAHCLAAADTAHYPQDDYEGRVVTACLAYRQFALERPMDFQLIYGNPIPGYVAPAEITIPVLAIPSSKGNLSPSLADLLYPL